MRLITRNLNQSAYQNLANESTPLSSSDAKAKWKVFKHRSSLQIALLEDQHFLCCYTEVDATNEGWGYHIEHIENKILNALSIQPILEHPRLHIMIYKKPI